MKISNVPVWPVDDFWSDGLVMIAANYKGARNDRRIWTHWHDYVHFYGHDDEQYANVGNRWHAYTWWKYGDIYVYSDNTILEKTTDKTTQSRTHLYETELFWHVKMPKLEVEPIPRAHFETHIVSHDTDVRVDRDFRTRRSHRIEHNLMVGPDDLLDSFGCKNFTKVGLPGYDYNQDGATYTCLPETGMVFARRYFRVDDDGVAHELHADYFGTGGGGAPGEGSAAAVTQGNMLEVIVSLQALVVSLQYRVAELEKEVGID